MHHPFVLREAWQAPQKGLPEHVSSKEPNMANPSRAGDRAQVKVKLLLPKFHRNRTRKYDNTAPSGGGCWVSLTGRFHRRSAAGWAECTVAGPGRVRRHAAQFPERSSAPLIGHARVALSEVLTRLPSTQTDGTQRGGKCHKLLPTHSMPWLTERPRREIVGKR